MGKQDLVVRFIGDTGNLTKGIDDVNGRFRTVASGLKGIAAAGAAVGAVSYFSNAINEAREAARVTRQTENVLRSTGGVANVTAKEVSGLAERLSVLAGVDDELIQSGANVLLTFSRVRNEVGQGNNVFDQATGLALDMSAALGTDLQGAVMQVGKALNDPIKGMTALTRAGVSFTAQQKEEIKALVEKGDLLGAQKIILRELETEFGGMAAATADAGTKLKVAWDNLSEDVGRKLMPAFNAVSDWALNSGAPALGQVADTVGDVVGPAFRGVVDVGREVVDVFQGLPGPIQAGVIALGAWHLVGSRVTSGLGQMTGPLRGFGSDVRTVMTASAGDVGRFGASMQVLQDRSPTIGAVGSAFRTARGDVDGFGSAVKGVGAGAFAGLKAGASGVMSLLGGPWGLAIIGATVGIGLFTSASRKAEERQRKLADAGRSVADALREQNGVINETVRKTAAKAAEDAGLLKVTAQLAVPMSQVTDAVLGQGNAYNQLRGHLQRVMDAHHEQIAVQSGAVDGAVTYVDSLDAEGQAAQESMGILESLTSSKNTQIDADKRVAAAAAETTAQLGAQRTAMGENQSSSEMLKTAVEGLGGEYDAAKTDGLHLIDVIKGLTQEQITAIDLEEAYEESLDQLTESIKNNGLSLDIHTEKGRNNRDALEEVATKIRDMTLADIEAGVPAAEAIARHDRRVDALRREAEKAGFSKTETEKLIATYSRVPGNVRTIIETQGFEATMAKLEQLSGSQALLAQGVAISPSNLRAWSNRGLAEGGLLEGPGTTTSDSIPAWLSRREFVHRASSVDHYGVGFMNAVNQRRFPKELASGFAGGGLAWPFPVDVSKTKIPEFGGSGTIGVLKRFAMAQAGKRYQWGATGPSTWDCSGLVGALWALAQGRNPYQRHMTTAGMGVGRHGMKPGRGAFTVYLGAGHTAANVGGLHAEAYGGNGVPLAIGRVGTPLSYYHTIMHLFAKGGLVGLKTNPTKRWESFQEKGWPEPPLGFKDGGWLGPGRLGYNETSEPEAVFNKRQLRAMATPKVDKHYHLTVYATNSEVDLRAQFRRMELLDG